MAHFAQIDQSGVVLRVIVAEQDFIDSGAVGDPKTWIQTSYNTLKGVHKEGGAPLRKNYAGVGFTYDKARDAFIPPKPYPSWELNAQTCSYEAPTTRPAIGDWNWDEKLKRWEPYVFAVDIAVKK